MSMTPTPPRQRGLSLVELMIGIAVGLFVLAGATFMLSNQLHDGRRLMLETQVQQDLRAAADIMVRELRRAGYSPTAENSAWFRGTTGVAQSAYSAIEASESEVRFRYGTDSDNAVQSEEQFGFRLGANGAIEFRLGDGAGAGNWQPLTDPGTLVIDRFAITQNLQTVNLGRYCPKPCTSSTPSACEPLQTIREYDIVIEGHAASDATVLRSLRAAVRPRNDVITGACPA
jgi:prepilin peptidase dependent protein B